MKKNIHLQKMFSATSGSALIKVCISSSALLLADRLRRAHFKVQSEEFTFRFVKLGCVNKLEPNLKYGIAYVFT